MRSLDPRETEYEYHKSGLYPNISEKSLEDLPHAGITNAKGLGIFLSTSKVQFHAESQEKKGKENLSLFIYLTLKRHWPMGHFKAKKGIKVSVILLIRTTVICIKYMKSHRWSLFPGTFGVLWVEQKFQKEAKTSYKSCLEKISPLFKAIPSNHM